MKRPQVRGGVDIIDRAHMEEVLKARLALAAHGSAHLSVETLEWMLRQEKQGANGPKIRPGVPTYNLVLLACWRGIDWNSATKTFNLMTGYHCHDFMDGAVAASPRVDQRPKSQQLIPTAETMSCLLRTALATQNSANMRQCLRIIDHFDKTGELLSVFSKNLAPESTKAMKNWSFHVVKLATAVLEAVNHISANNNARDDELKLWNRLRGEAKRILEADMHKIYAQTPDPAAEEFVPQARRDNEERGQRPLTKYEMAFGSRKSG
ncbi:Pentatricopeptide repeat-containing protein [Mycena venus]|uniref:Pentatricopeptide repeat-containing protein n=1 Tax=Mycena venus TaxID=2733690 RepID=A0A8H6Y2D2_9AGAR|nr:Pentatricopeptide repeat-containing protein [Mycena venus]